jgi:nucleotide-binding universal stress UspA family protein
LQEDTVIAIKNVLVATDFSDAAAAALNYGRELARSYQATLHVLHVVDDMRWRYSLDMTPSLMVGVQESLEEAARTQMNALVTDEDRRQLRAQASVQTALSTADAIVDYARTAGIDILVVGTHGRGGVQRLLLGSVAERLVRLAPCPVLTVRTKEREFIAPDALAGTKAAAARA